LFRFDIFIARCLGGQFFTGHSVCELKEPWLPRTIE